MLPEKPICNWQNNDIGLLKQSNPKSASLFKLQEIGNVLEGDTFVHHDTYLGENSDYMDYIDGRMTFDEMLGVLEQKINMNKDQADAFQASSDE